MKVKSQTLEGYVDRAKQILDGLEGAYEATSAFEDIWDTTIEDLEAIVKHPNGDRYMPFSKHPIRYPYNQSIPGLIAETIAAINLYHQLGYPITRATTRNTQYIQGIDLWINPDHQNHTVQVKAIRLVKNKLDRETDFSNIKTDWVSLVDIDNYHHFFLERNSFLRLLSNKNQQDITTEELETLSTYYFDNVKYYGYPEDKLVRGIKSEK